MASLKFTIPLVLFTVIIWTALFCDAEANAGGDLGKVLRKGGSNQREFDYFQFALAWPATFCRRNSECCEGNACCLYPSTRPRPTRLNSFVIWGLWPDYNDGTWPSCCPGESFDIKKISSLLPALNRYWPALDCDSSFDCYVGEGSVWQYEWETHGTCASSVLGDQYNYFLTGLDLYHKYNVTVALQEAGYEPSNNAIYDSEGIISAIRNVFPGTPQLECSGGDLEEVHLCFTKDFKPRDCAAETNTEKSCPKSVRLPPLYEPREVELKLPSSI